jgi:hypothetical protein
LVKERQNSKDEIHFHLRELSEGEEEGLKEKEGALVHEGSFVRRLSWRRVA